jgi:acyl carrier protein
MDNTTIERDIRDFLAQNFPLSDEGSELAGSDSLIEAGVIDSTGVLELIEFLEATYDIQIADEEVLPDNLDSIERIGRFVTSKLGNGSDGRAADTGV